MCLTMKDVLSMRKVLLPKKQKMTTKGKSALALAAALWIGTAGTAAAEDASYLFLDADNNNQLVLTSDIDNYSAPLTSPLNAVVETSGKSLTISGDGSTLLAIGGFSNKNSADGYTVNAANYNGYQDSTAKPQDVLMAWLSAVPRSAAQASWASWEQSSSRMPIHL